MGMTHRSYVNEKMRQQTNSISSTNAKCINFNSARYSHIVYNSKQVAGKYATPMRNALIHPPSQYQQKSPIGVLAGYYAGCKFSDSPAPSALPLPPKHWMQKRHPSTTITTNTSSRAASETSTNYFLSSTNGKYSHHDFTEDLKLLLKIPF